jgi:hypothetical protein
MPIQLRMLDEDERRDARSSTWSSLPESVRRDVHERFAELLVVIVRSETRKERSNDLDEDQVDARGA